MFLAAIIVSIIILFNFRHDIRAWNDYNVYLISKEYFNYKKHGGKYKDEYYSAINMDKYRDELGLGISLSDLILKYPDSRKSSSYKFDSYRGNAAKYYLKSNKDELLYLDNKSKNGNGWAILIRNGVGIEIVLIKG